MRFILIVLAAVALASHQLAAQDAVVSRNVNLRSDPSTQNPAIRLLLPGAELFLLESGKTNGYYRVRTMAGEEGWAYGARIRLLPQEEGPSEFFNDCPMEGNAVRADIRQSNRLKNRFTAPQLGEIDGTITLAGLLQSGDDDTRFSNDVGATVVGYVYDVKAGSAESVNCGATTVAFKDTHIEVTLNDTDTDETRRFIAEVTPKWRAHMADRGEDWSNVGLRDLIEGRCAEITGWMFWDKHHRGDAENTDPGAGNNWRATAWEIHPVTAIRVVTCPN
jgi:hypothetical protein